MPMSDVLRVEKIAFHFSFPSSSLKIRVCLAFSFVTGYRFILSVTGFRSLSCLPNNASYHYTENLVALLSVCKQQLHFIFFKTSEFLQIWNN